MGALLSLVGAPVYSRHPPLYHPPATRTVT